MSVRSCMACSIASLTQETQFHPSLLPHIAVCDKTVRRPLVSMTLPIRILARIWADGREDAGNFSYSHVLLSCPETTFIFSLAWQRHPPDFLSSSLGPMMSDQWYLDGMSTRGHATWLVNPLLIFSRSHFGCFASGVQSDIQSIFVRWHRHAQSGRITDDYVEDVLLLCFLSAA